MTRVERVAPTEPMVPVTPSDTAAQLQLGAVRLGTTTTLVMAAAAMPATTVGVLAPHLVSGLGIGPAVIGQLVAVNYGVGALLSPASGVAVDRFGERRLLAGLVLSAGTAVALLATALTAAVLLLAMTAAGLSLAIANPVTNRLVQRAAAPEQAGVIVGLKQSAVPLGWVIVGVQIPLLVPVLGWRPATASLLVVILVAALLTWQLPRTPALARSGVRGRTDGGLRPWVLVLAGLLGTGTSGVVAYLPLTAVELSGLAPARAGLVAGVVGAAGVGSRLAWGWASRRIERLHLALAGISVLAVLGAGLVLASERLTSAIWLAAVVFGASSVSAMVVLTVHLLRVSGPAAVGRATGWVSLAFFGGFVPGPLLFGVLVTRSGGYRLPWLVVAALFALGAVVALLASRSAPIGRPEVMASSRVPARRIAESPRGVSERSDPSEASRPSDPSDPTQE